jgi:glycosyltransferase involved in cell wall biosynthesis
MRRVFPNRKTVCESVNCSAAYNGERTIAETVDSALAQTYKDYEIVVVNDGSADLTDAILREYGDQIQIVTQVDRGAAAVSNVGVAHSTGDYVAFLDSDDLLSRAACPQYSQNA